MTAKTKSHTGGTPNFRPTDLLICEKCGHEFTILPSKKKAICPKCNHTFNKSNFVPLTIQRTLWVNQSMLPQYNEEVVFKQVMKNFNHTVDLYRELFIHSVDMRAMKALGFFAYGFRFGIKSAYSIDISWEETARMIRQYMNAVPLFGLLDSAKIELGAARGRPLRPERLILLIDAMLLSFYPNGYLLLLQDALTLRYKEYTVNAKYARVHRERWARFHRSKRSTEVYCRRIWRDLFRKEPGSIPEDWHLDVAREQGLIDGEDKKIP